jgi:hypothetical protein
MVQSVYTYTWRWCLAMVQERRASSGVFGEVRASQYAAGIKMC